MLTSVSLNNSFPAITVLTISKKVGSSQFSISIPGLVVKF